MKKEHSSFLHTINTNRKMLTPQSWIIICINWMINSQPDFFYVQLQRSREIMQVSGLRTTSHYWLLINRLFIVMTILGHTLLMFVAIQLKLRHSTRQCLMLGTIINNNTHTCVTDGEQRMCWLLKKTGSVYTLHDKRIYSQILQITSSLET